MNVFNIFELTENILENLDYISILRFSVVNKEIYYICSNDIFWKQKMKNEYLSLIIYKPYNITYKEQYKSLHIIQPYIEIVKQDRIDLIYYMRNHIPNKKTFDVIISKGNLNILNIYAQWNILPPSVCYITALLTNQYEILEWLINKRIPIFKQLEEFIFGKAYKIHTKIIKRLNHKKLIKTLEWLENYNIYLNSSLVYLSIIKNKICVVKWLRNRGYGFTTDMVNWSCNAGNFNFLKWFVENGYKPGIDAANLCYNNNSIKILNYLEKINILPNYIAANNAIIYENYKMLMWLINRNILPTSIGANYAASISNIQILDFLKEKSILPNFITLNSLLYQNNKLLLDWVDKNNLLNYIDIPFSVMFIKQIDIIEWFYIKGVNFNTNIADLACIYENFVLIEWLFEKKIYPTNYIIIKYITTSENTKRNKIKLLKLCNNYKNIRTDDTIYYLLHSFDIKNLKLFLNYYDITDKNKEKMINILYNIRILYSNYSYYVSMLKWFKKKNYINDIQYANLNFIN